jgi:peptidoglycan hydrolase-like protein with peptidoglycan-binding domain
MTIGASDYLNGGQVSQLQSFLANSGLLSSAYITGYYGSLTASAVAQFQASRGISPTGVVGPLTRAAIQSVSCGTTSIVSPSQPIYPVNPGGPIIINGGNGYQYGYGYLTLASLSANTNTGSLVITLKGSGFDATNNTVHFGSAVISGIASNGTQLSFQVPAVTAGTYLVSVTTSHGTTNSLSYYVQSNNTYNNGNTCSWINNTYQCGCAYPATTYNSTNWSYNNNTNCGNQTTVSLSSLSQTSGYVGSSVTVYGNGFTTNNNSVHFGNTVISNLYSSNGTSITFTIPSVSTNNSYGTYSVYVTNGNGYSSNSIQFTVNGNGYNNGYNNGQLNISYLSPASGSVGTQIAIQGSGFSSTNNTVHFGAGGVMNVPSYNNGTVIYYTVPTSVGPCSVSTGVCAQYLQLVTTGSYPVYVTNPSGTSSNTLYFQVF